MSDKISKHQQNQNKPMRAPSWNPPIDLSFQEEKIIQLIKRAKLFTFLRSIRHLLFDEALQQELAKM